MDQIAPPFHSDIPTKPYDAIVVGGGHNGLVCAAYLAKAGKQVLVLENRHILGGAAASDEIFPGFTFSVYSYVVSLFRPHIVRELDLTRHGYQVIPLECTFTPFPDGESMTRCGDPEATRREIARFSPTDAEMAPRFSLAMTQMASFIKHMIDSPAPDPASLRISELTKLIGLGRRFRALADGDAWVQDEAAQLVACLFGPRLGPSVADLCAAPGGKTLVLAAALNGDGIQRAVSWAGALLQDPHRPMAAQRGIDPYGVYVAFFSYGSPATRYGLWAGRRVVEVNETPTPDLQAFIDAVKDIRHRESVRLKTVSWNDTPEIITLKLDTQYWPAYEIRRTEDGWRRVDFGS